MVPALGQYLVFTAGSFEIPAQNHSADLSVENSLSKELVACSLWMPSTRGRKEDNPDGVLSVSGGGDVFLSA